MICMNLSQIKTIVLFTTIAVMTACNSHKSDLPKESIAYSPNWESLKKHTTPEWLREGKFGIYTHWGAYSVPAKGKNGTWYPHFIYTDNKDIVDFHESNYGPVSEFGYKDFIPLFKGEKFDAEEWAELFKKSGARFAGPVAEHHDGFAMWDTKYSEWNAAKMGPIRDVVGELEKAIKKRDMKFVTAFHHAANYFFFPVWDKRLDCSNPEYSGLYGPIHEKDDPPSKEWLDEWHGKLIEVIDNYSPDYIWFDYKLDLVQESYVKDFVAYYYNEAERQGKEVVISYKDHDLPPGVGLLDMELAQQDNLTHSEWITDTSVDDQGAWSYVEGAKYKSVNRLVDNLVDRVSKNGYLLLNVGPKADGTIPEEARKCLLGIGKWLDINGEAIYGTSAWTKFGEGPAEGFEETNFNNEKDVNYTSQDIRFTVKDNILYAIVLDWPKTKVQIRNIVPGGGGGKKTDGYNLYPDEIQAITMLGSDEGALEWNYDTIDGLTITPPKSKPCEHAFVLKIERN